MVSFRLVSKSASSITLDRSKEELRNPGATPEKRGLVFSTGDPGNAPNADVTMTNNPRPNQGVPSKSHLDGRQNPHLLLGRRACLPRSK